MIQLIARLFGENKSKKDITLLRPLLEQIRQHFEQLAALDNNALRAKTAQFKQRIADSIRDIMEQRDKLQSAFNELSDQDLAEKEKLYQGLEEWRQVKNKRVEQVLMALLPEAFAVVKETARRFTEQDQLRANLTDFDRHYLKNKPYVIIEGEEIIFESTWAVGTNPTRWNMVHYDVQLIGGMVLHQGKIAEIATGEGKTLVSTLPTYLNALTGEGVHIITVNDYLAKRDAEWNAPIFEFLGLSVDCIDKYEPHTEERKKAYEADITYGTNNEFGFDYLRDNMVSDAQERVQRKYHHYAIIDEVDSVLIDDARTPLIISGPVGKDETREKFQELRIYIEKIVAAQRSLLLESLAQAKKQIAEGKDGAREGGLSLYRVYRGLPKLGPLIKYLSEPHIKSKLHKVENQFLADNQKEMRNIVDKELYFYIEEKNNTVELTEKGLDFLTHLVDDKSFFTLNDISEPISALENNTSLTEEERSLQKEKLMQEYATQSERIHTMKQLLKAYTLFEKDVEYVVIDNQVKIVDEQTGRVMEGRRYSDGLHQALEAKEKVTIEAASQTYATITLQNYFRMYHKLSGMTGTAETEATEFWKIYKLDVVSVPTNVPVIRKDFQDLVFKTKREKYKALIAAVEKLSAEGRAVLVGTTSVEVSELLSRMLQQKGIKHNVLNAKQHKREAQIVAEAGLEGRVTIATNMAGRGTDIRLSDVVKANGGLAILGTERHESRRVDRQLRGRSGRQGDPGTSQFFVSLEDDLMRMFGSERIASLMDKMGYKEGDVIQHSLVTRSIERAQKKVEENNFGIRKRLLEYDDVMNKQRNIIYKRRMNALFGEELALDIDHAFYTTAHLLTEDYLAHKDKARHRVQCLTIFNMEPPAEAGNIVESAAPYTDTLYKAAIDLYRQKQKSIATNIAAMIRRLTLNYPQITQLTFPLEEGKKTVYVTLPVQELLDSEGAGFGTHIEKNTTLQLIDEAWKEHLKLMDELRHSVQNAVYEQKDPLVIYKGEAFVLFEQLNWEIQKRIVTFLMHYRLQESHAPMVSVPRAHKDAYYGATQLKPQTDEPNEADEKSEPIVVAPKIGRNEPCPCGSGKKYKQCHGR